MTSTEQLRCAVIGAGAIAHAHARAVAAHPGARLVGVADLDPARAAAFAAEWDVPASFGGLDEMLDEVRPDVVLVCTPPGAHHAQTLAALAAGADVVVEKPPAASLAELDEMRAAADAAGRRLVVVFQQRSGTAAAHVRGLLASGALGRPLVAQCQTLWYRDASYFAVPWRGKWATEGGGTTLGHGIHQIDLLAHLLGDWASVRGELWRLDRETETEDVSTATILFAGGTVAQVTTSTLSPRETSTLRIDTERATVTVDHLYGHGHGEWSITPAPSVPPEEAAGWAFPDVEERSDHAPFLRDVFDALVSGGPLPAVAEQPARSFEIVAAIYASAAAGGAPVTPADLAAHPTHRGGFASPVRDLRPAP